MGDRISVFISSTSLDLTAYREKIQEIILKLGMHPIAMETFNPSDFNALQVCYDKLCECDIFVGVYAHRYGYAPDFSASYTTIEGEKRAGNGLTSITHLEYLWALERNMPLLLFVLSDTDATGELLDWPPAYVEAEPGKSQIKRFKATLMNRHVVGFFHSPDHLAAQVATGLAEINLKREFTKPTSSRPVNKVTTRYLKWLREDIDNRLSVSIHRARLLDLGLEQKVGAVRPWTYQGYKQDLQMRTFQDFDEAFNEFNRRLLVLGAPGSGKSTTLLDIARQLTIQAQTETSASIPVLLNLTRWSRDVTPSSDSLPFLNPSTSAVDLQSFTDWLANAISETPGGVPKNEARQWVANGQIALLLDGLDEVETSRRAEVVQAINNYARQQPDIPIVVCSRVTDYEPLMQSRETQLRLNGAVTLQAPDDIQIQIYLSAARADGLREAIASDYGLHELARIPLTLSMMVLAYGDSAASAIPQNLSLTERRRHLFDFYIDRMMQRAARRMAADREIHTESLNPSENVSLPYTRKQVNDYLGWVAARLIENAQNTFSANQLAALPIRKRPGQRTLAEPITLLNALLIFLLASFVVAILNLVSGSDLGALGLYSVSAGLTGLMSYYIMLRDLKASFLATTADRQWRALLLLTWVGCLIISTQGLHISLASIEPPVIWIEPLVPILLVLLIYNRRIFKRLNIVNPELMNWILAFCGFVAFNRLAAQTGLESQIEARASLSIALGCVIGLMTFPNTLLWTIPTLVIIVATAFLAMVIDPILVWVIIPIIIIWFILQFSRNAPTSPSDNESSLSMFQLWMKRLTQWSIQISQMLLAPLIQLMGQIRGEIPHPTTSFFDFATNAMILKRSGNDFEFIHRLLRDHFAEQMFGAGAIHYVLLGHQQFENGDYEAMHDSFVQAVHFAPNSPTPYLWWADCYRVLGRYSEAVAHFDRAIALGSTDVTTYHLSAVAHLGNGTYEEAYQNLNLAIQHDPERGIHYYWRALAEIGLSHYAEALADLTTRRTKPLESTDNIRYVMLWESVIHSLCNRENEAQHAFAECMRLASESETLDQIIVYALQCLLSDDPETAWPYLTQIMEGGLYLHQFWVIRLYIAILVRCFPNRWQIRSIRWRFENNIVIKYPIDV